MRTTIDIPDNLIEEAKKLLKTKTKKHTVEKALKEIIKIKSLEIIKSMAGKVEFDMSADEIRK